MRKLLVVMLIVVLLVPVLTATAQDDPIRAAKLSPLCTAVVQYDVYLIGAMFPPPMLTAGEVLYNVRVLSAGMLTWPWVYFSGTDLQPGLSGYAPRSALVITCV